MRENYYHMFASGDDARDFITSEDEFKAAMNRFAICSCLSGATVVSASVEDTHPHSLLWGTFRQCSEFAYLYEDISLRSICRRRGSVGDARLHCELYEITDEQYLRNVGVYTIIQATKDGKAVMPYDYKYGTGALYFRSKGAVMPWHIDADGLLCVSRPISSLTYREKKAICGSRIDLPGDWLICNGIILPECYVDIKRFESIYRTHNCFRTFLGNSKYRDDDILQTMACVRGVMIDDLEARRICGDLCMSMFNRNTTRMLSLDERLMLARELHQTYRLSYRQISTLVKISESELRTFVK